MCCDNTVGSNIVGTALSFSLNFSENRIELCLVCKWICGKMKWTKDQVLIDAVWIFIQNKVDPLFLTLGLEEGNANTVFHNLALHSILLSSKQSLSFGFSVAFAALVIYTMCMNWWAGLNRQWCRSRRWCSSAEAVLIHTITA